MTGNVYSAPDNVPIGEYVATVGRSGAPDLMYDPRAKWPGGEDGYLDSPAGTWAPTLEPGVDSTPDNRRLNRTPWYQYRPDGSEPPEDWWTGPHGPGRDIIARGAVETVDADGWRQTRGDMTRKRSAPSVYRTPPPENRPTQQMSPASYSFTRPFDQEVARRNNGVHFSMADHRRNYEIGGMQPVSNRRNTFRAEPQPWDSDIVDRVPDYTPTAARIIPVDLPLNRPWRLG